MPPLPSLPDLVTTVITVAEPYVRDYGYPLGLASAVMEHSVLLGWLVPGGTLIVLAAFYAQQGVLEPSGVAALALAGFMAGDGLDYLLGRLGGRRVIGLLARRGLWQPREEFIHQHLGKLLLLAYLGSLTRSAAIITAGASGVRYRRLLPFSFAANVCLVALYLAIGAVAGQHLHTLIGLLERLTLSTQVALALAILVVGAAVLRRRPAELARWLRPKSRAHSPGSEVES